MGSLHAVIVRNIRGYRAARRFKQSDLAEAAARAGRPELTRSVISALERGARRVDLDDLPALCAALDVTLPDLLAGRDAEDARRALGI